jgi:hypothetical protein
MSRYSRIPTCGCGGICTSSMGSTYSSIKVFYFLACCHKALNTFFTGYPSSPFTIRPFDEPEIAAASDEDKGRMRAFNLRLSSVRVVVEHSFGLFKGRFPTLRGMGPHQDIQEIYKTIEALMVLHNMAIDPKDRPEVSWHINEDPDDQEDQNNGDRDVIAFDVVGDAQVPAYETDAYLKEQGQIKRLAILDRLF